MNFISFVFLIFLAVTLLGFNLLSPRFRKLFLLAMSYVFYATWNVPFIALILFSTTFDYWMSQIIVKSNDKNIRRAAMMAGLIVNLGLLGYFKYANFFLENAGSLLQWLKLSVAMPEALQVILPLGISFYTFEAISYLVDVYRGKAPARNWLEYNFYIMYFPHLISGPIIRFGELASQYKEAIQRPPAERMAGGVELILLGYVFKVFIADPVSELAVPVFENPVSFGALETWLGVLAFTVQIYFDFMGYTHIARGVSLLLNIELPLNFNHPYHARNMSDFWQRWHISLSRWIRDYLYFPLGGSRGALSRTVFNLILTMLICGAWHGAGWTFIMWGLYHGVLLGGYHLFKHYGHAGRTQAQEEPLPRYLASVGLTFLLVACGWVFFRARNISTAFGMLGTMFNPALLWKDIASMDHFGTFAGILGMLALCWIGPTAVRLLAAIYRPMPFWLKVQTACVFAFVCWLMTAEATKPFIYFQF